MISKAMVFSAYRRRIDAIARQGTDIGLVVPSHWGELPLEVSSPPNYRLHVLKAFFSGKNHFHLYSQLRKVLETERPDIVHIDEEPYSLVTWQALREAARIGAKSLFYTWQNIEKHFPPPFSWIERRTLGHCGVALAGNEEAAEILRRKGYRKPIHVVPQMGVDPEAFSPAKSSHLRKEMGLDGDFVVGYLGRLLPEKGIATLIDAVESVAKNRPVKLLIRGSGPLLGMIKERAEKSPLHGRVKAAERVSSEEIPEYIRAMDCLVLPSLTRRNWKEQFGRVLVEAMSCGVPVIGSDSGEIPNVIADAGMVFPEGNSEELAEKISFLMDNPQTRQDMATCGRERVLKNYTHQRIAEQTVAAYRELLDAG